MSRPLGAWNLDRSSYEVEMVPAHLCLRTAPRIRCGHSYICEHVYIYVFPPLHPDDAGPGSAWVEHQVGHVCKALGEGWGKIQHHILACNLNPPTKPLSYLWLTAHTVEHPLFMFLTSLLLPPPWCYSLYHCHRLRSFPILSAQNSLSHFCPAPPTSDLVASTFCSFLPHGFPLGIHVYLPRLYNF